jgi:cilia- and flagella-associated protein 43
LIQVALKGSIASLFNGDSSLFYSQFELYTPEQKLMQLVLIQDAIYRIKENFNSEFELVMERKNQEISKIREKHQRLKQIHVDLNEEKQLDEPQLGDAESPESLFQVKDSEVNKNTILIKLFEFIIN